MKKILRGFSAVIVMTLIFNVFSINNAANDIAASENGSAYYYNERENEIFEKIELLAELKAEALAVKEFWNLDEYPDMQLIDYEELLDEIESVRSELIALGAKPSEEVLSSIKFDNPISADGVLIEDFAGFERTFDGAFDLWGVEKTVNASYGTYYTYDIMLQDYAGNDILSTKIRQGNSHGYDIYASSSSVSSLMLGELGELLFEKTVEKVVENVPVIGGLYRGAQILQTLKSISNEVNDDYTVSSGMSKSYRIYCTTSPTVHFVFVRNSTNSAWQHSLTTNTAYLKETHYCYMTFSVGGGRIESHSGEKDYSRTVLPDRYNYRLTDAITAYRNGNSLYSNVIDEYTITAVKNRVSRDIFSIDIACPITQADLIRYGVHRMGEPCLRQIMVVAGVSALLFLSLFAVFKVKKRQDK